MVFLHFFWCSSSPVGLGVPSGKYGNAEALAGCVECEEGLDSLEGSTVCDLADTHYYLSDPTLAKYAADPVPNECPENANCFGGLLAAAPKAGYWSDRAAWGYTSEVYECVRSTCKGTEINNATGNQSCWHLMWFPDTDDFDDASFTFDDDDGCNDQGKLMCTKGASGPLCGTCE